MKRFAAIGLVCATCLLWTVNNAANMSPQFPEPIAGYRDDFVGYDDLPPDKPAKIELSGANINAATKTLPSLTIADSHDGVEVTGTLLGISSSKARVACIAVDVTRQFEQEHQLIASCSDFFELNNGTAEFRISIRLPNLDAPMQITLLAILLDEEGVPVGSESIVATGSLRRTVP
jgi:hypothetical protein